ncbi:hypothetical protein NUW58_g2230 [Xylaria curta]|uniref:Uncharacterized protein n=1 Tax=Xylaria curta TaxID=42375 RepID=A0ACC1PJ35_9PEZI|nr:hypothetical protein NUW58_g2230 [Xylaria curta]
MATRNTPNQSPVTTSTALEFDVVIIGAGIAGINSAYRLQTQGPPGLKYVILENRDSIGGTWDLFRYPGIRSDSDIFTFGLSWSPWKGGDTVVPGGEIKNYLVQSAKSAGIDQHIRYHHKVETADWQSTDQRWVFQVNVAGKEKPVIYRSRFALLGTGYYDYETPRQTVIPGIENFKGKVIHPQFWPEDYDYTGKDVVVIGSGATAITIIPSIADKAKRATMLQRSPGYIVSLHSTSFFARFLFAILPAAFAHKLNRLVWLSQGRFATWFCTTFPERAKKLIRTATIEQLPPDIKWDPNFKPRYNPWDQRLCVSKDGDFYAVLRSGKANVVTDEIKAVTSNTIELRSGASLHPDVIVTATGLKLRFGGGIQFSVDGERIEISDKFAWKAAMLEDVPNLVFMLGYENASWTLGVDVGVHLFIRLLGLMKEKNAMVIVPKLSVPIQETRAMKLTSTYITTAGRVWPKAGTGQWSPKTNYFVDMAKAKWGNVTEALVTQSLQQAWIHLLRLCSIKGLENAGSPKPAPDITIKLQHYIGDMSPAAFRQGLWEFILAEPPGALVLRFLRARKWDVEKAMAMLVSAVNWRVQRNMAETVIRVGESVGLKEDPSPDEKALISQYRSGKLYSRGMDKENHPVYIIKVRLHDPQLQSSEAVEIYILHHIESLRTLATPTNDEISIVFDMTGFGMKNMDFHIVKFLASVFEARYPETLGVVLIHNAPFIFWGIWNIIKGWLDPVVASKIHFTRKPADLLQFISEENLQTSFGGKDTWEYEYIEPVPGENARLEEVEKRAEIQQEQNKLIGEFEQKTIDPCGCISICGVDVIPQNPSSVECPMLSKMHSIIRRANVLAYKIEKINRYIEMGKNIEARKEDITQLERSENDFLVLNADMRDILLELDEKSWDTLTNQEEFCSLFESIFGWHLTEIREKRRRCSNELH